MYGPHNTSEAALAKTMAQRIPVGDIVMADSGFGIFGVAYHLFHGGHPILFCMTKSRFKSVCRHAAWIEDRDDRRTYQARWTPSAKERKTHAELPEDATLDVFLHEVPLENGELLYLVTTLPIASETAAQYYGRRYDVEHDIRDVKVTLNIERIRARTVDMVQKELLTSIVAYNLVVQFRRQAAALASVPPRRLSFTEVWDTSARSCSRRAQGMSPRGQHVTARRWSWRPNTASSQIAPKQESSRDRHTLVVQNRPSS